MTKTAELSSEKFHMAELLIRRLARSEISEQTAKTIMRKYQFTRQEMQQVLEGKAI